jgi:hypothetical protein
MRQASLNQTLGASHAPLNRPISKIGVFHPSHITPRPLCRINALSSGGKIQMQCR